MVYGGVTIDRASIDEDLGSAESRGSIAKTAEIVADAIDTVVSVAYPVSQESETVLRNRWTMQNMSLPLFLHH